MASKDEICDFMAVFPDIVRELTDDGRRADITDMNKWYSKMLHYNVPNGERKCGLSLVKAYKMLEDPNKLTPENLRLAHIMGWCIEIMVASFTMLDDIIDGSEMRRGKLCWYRNDDVGLSGSNDAVLMEQGAYILLKRHFSDLPYYVPALELFHELGMKITMGQSQNMMPNREGKPDLSLFTMKRYNVLTKCKTAHVFHVPITLAMYMAGKSDFEVLGQAEMILQEIGHLYQVRDDFLNCFGESSNTIKRYSDIRHGKCSWLIVMALQKVSPKQKEILEANYGRSEPAAIQKVRSLYEELGLPKTYSTQKEESCKLIRMHIQQISGIPYNIFLRFMDEFHKA